MTLKTHIDGEETRRSYSICVGVTDYDRDGELRIGIKRVRGGRFSNFAFDTLQPGHEIDVMTPDGRFFTHLNADHAKHYVAFSGGSGITPVLAIIKTTLETEPTSRFTLVYGNRSVDAIMFAEELEDLKNRYHGAGSRCITCCRTICRTWSCSTACWIRRSARRFCRRCCSPQKSTKRSSAAPGR